VPGREGSAIDCNGMAPGGDLTIEEGSVRPRLLRIACGGSGRICHGEDGNCKDVLPPKDGKQTLVVLCHREHWWDGR
jgi:hypothetical protein